MEQEIFKPIIGYEGSYEISSFGRVRSLINNIFLKSWRSAGGYRSIGLRKFGVKKTHSVHVLVAKHFLQKYNPKAEVNHKNFDRTDNRVINLEWLIRLDNIQYSVKAGRITGWRGENSPRAKHTNESILKIRELYKSGQYTQNQIAEMFNVKRHNIAKIISRQRWQHI